MTRVEGYGNRDANIILVGEAPGKEEDYQGIPFVGKAGQLTERYYSRHGLSLDEDVYRTNLFHWRPPGNKFERIRKDPRLDECLEVFAEDVREIQPNVIHAAGAWPLYYLTGLHGKSGPGSGILNWRGSILETNASIIESLPEGIKVIPSLHPAYILRNWTMNPVFHFDIGRIIDDSRFPELQLPRYKSYIDPPKDILISLVEESMESEIVSLDIETFPNGTFSCIGFTPSEEWGATVTFQTPELWHLVKALWEHPVPKMMQFGTYDVSFMKYFYDWDVGGWYSEGSLMIGWDTFVAAAELMPELPHGLHFLASIYTRFPYYKEDRKQWKEDGDMNVLWEYNIKDIIATLQIGLQQMPEMEELYLIEGGVK